MLPDRVSNPGPLTYESRPTDCATRPGFINVHEELLHYTRHQEWDGHQHQQNVRIFTLKFFYVMGKALMGELSYRGTGLVNHAFCGSEQSSFL